MHLEKASEHIPPGLKDLLLELSNSEGGFSGTTFGCGTSTLEEFLCACREGEDAAKVGPGLVPQSVFWMIDDAGQAVGMVRVRHHLNERLVHNGGNVGYYVRPSERGKGCATQVLRQAVVFLASIGVPRVLVTVSPRNASSTGVVLANGGVEDEPGVHPDSGERVNRYWIEAGRGVESCEREETAC